MPRRLLALFWLLVITSPFLSADRPAAPQPLYRDPVFDGAADPVVIWNPSTETWWMFYTNRRANVPGLSGVAWVHGTRVSIAESADRGLTWIRRGDADITLPPQIGGDQPTHWAPDVLTGPDGTHHMYLTVVPGVFEDWRHPRRIVHLTSSDLAHWDYQSALEFASDRVIDAGVARQPDGTWRMWYNNERDGKSIYYADSPDLYTWTDQGKATGVGERPGEGPYVFHWRGTNWMLVDLWKGLGVYHSDDLLTWTAQDGDLLNSPGLGPDDGVNGGHPGVVVCGDRAYLFYFTHPGRAGTIAPGDGDNLDLRRSSIQVTELHLTAEGDLTCDRDAPTFIDLIPPPAAADSRVTLTEISPQAFAGSSINAPPGYHQSLVSSSDHQYAGYYAADGTVVIATQELPNGAWTTHPTTFTGSTADAHNTIALGLDGSGALHLAWGHHNIPLQYARSSAAAPLTFGEPQPMLGRQESSVTYPQFLPLPDGDLLFIHRDGGSGRGNLILNRYDPSTTTWSRVHDNLIDGEGRRNAYATPFVDAHGTLHLAWVWRETPDVATNHDLAYARSHDGGVTWSDADGRPLDVPFNAATAAYAARIPTGSDLMNPPALAADTAGRPLIANYWREPGDVAPQYRLLRHAQGTWTRHTLTTNTIDFQLAGRGTKRSPFSRGIISAGKTDVAFLFRHDAFDGAPLLISTTDITTRSPSWTTTVLPTGNLGAWEPTADASAAGRHSIQVLTSTLHQRDGNDHEAATLAPQPLSLLNIDLAATSIDFPNPLILQRADPHIHRGDDGFYYYMGTVPSYDRLELRRARTIAGLATAAPRTIWTKHATGPMGDHIWAPEIHRLDGKWYVYFAAGDAENRWHLRIYVLENASPNPLEGAWTELGPIDTGWDNFALDATLFEHRETTYLLWAQKGMGAHPNSNLYIAPLASPTTLAAPAVMLSEPDYDWEKVRYAVNEGPVILRGPDQLFLTYSAAGTGPEYCVGMLTADLDADLMDPTSWTKSAEPVFQSSPENQIYGPGHHTFVKADDGVTDLIVYHARDYAEISGDPLRDPNRHTRVQTVPWRADGTPDFGVPRPNTP